MALSESMEMPPTAGRTPGPIAVFSNSYARLPEHFFARLAPTPVAKPHLIKFNDALASELGVNTQGLDPDRLAAMFAGNVTPSGAEPIAMVYAGHQFGNFVPQLGDGRAILLGEVLDRNGERRDVQLKGSGRTPFSRRGDGRAALGPVLREYLVSEAMHALGIPTTRALAAVTTGEPVYRDRKLPGAVLTRVASSHIRVGTFQYFAAHGGVGAAACHYRGLGEESARSWRRLLIRKLRVLQYFVWRRAVVRLRPRPQEALRRPLAAFLQPPGQNTFGRPGPAMRPSSVRGKCS
jgi:hypothetical protein